jgi:hypothetical protein
MSYDVPYTTLSGQKIPNEWLDQIIRHNAREIARSSESWDSSGCLFDDMGNFFVRSVADLSRLAEKTVHGQHIGAYIKNRMGEMEKQHDFSELDSFNYLTDKHKALE